MNAPGNRAVGIWLLLCCALVFAMVVLGGVTRLTGSGLSMVDWRPITGWLPPLNAEQWEAVFALYQQSPEFQKVNASMDVEGFKGIFWLEYLHRLLGRTIGVVFLLPFLFFAFTGRIAKRDLPKYLFMFILGGLQGVLGWYMVRSGLVDNPRVSPYRLTAHLLLAFLIYAWMFWVALSLLVKRQAQRHPLYSRTVVMTALIVVTVVSGGFVAGLDAGFGFNTFPQMGGQWIPEGIGMLEPAWRNFFENPVTAQFDHRVLALITLIAVVTWWVLARACELSSGLRVGANLLLAAVVAQVALGISTLLLVVPVALAAAHQAAALLLFTVALYLCHGLRGAPARS